MPKANSSSKLHHPTKEVRQLAEPRRVEPQLVDPQRLQELRAEQVKQERTTKMSKHLHLLTSRLRKLRCKCYS